MIAGAGRYPSLSAMGSYQRSQYSTKFFQRPFPDRSEQQRLARRAECDPS
ncbi:hypothetical protein [Sorlinia euscelidii]